MVDEILEILTDTCCSRRPVIRIGGEDKPAQIVKSKFMKLDGEHIRYVLACFLENTTRCGTSSSTCWPPFIMRR